jgi:hypothetical protein
MADVAATIELAHDLRAVGQRDDDPLLVEVADELLDSVAASVLTAIVDEALAATGRPPSPDETVIALVARLGDYAAAHRLVCRIAAILDRLDAAEGA